jgi:hypothetical protein
VYKIYLNNLPIYDARDKEYLVENPNLELEINKVGSLKFKINDTHPYFDRLEKLSTVLTVYKGNKTIFKGRIVGDEQGLYNEKNIECEGVLGYLNDSIVRPYSFTGTPTEHFTNLLNNHNSQVETHQQLKIGTITVTDPNNYIVRSSVNYGSTWDILNEDLINKLGGYLRVRYETDGTYVDYLADFNDTSTQTIELGKNLIDVLVKNDAADVYTAVIPLGAEIQNEDETTSQLTIKSVNNGLDYIVNQEALNKYGLIFAPVEKTTWKDVTIASNLKTKGTAFLNNEAVMLKSSLEVSAVDLNATDEQIEAFFIYEYIRFISPIHNINQIFLLNKISIPMNAPKNMKITLGKETSSLTGIQMGNKQDIDNVINRVNIVEKNYTINNEKLNDIEKTLEYFSVDLTQYNLTIPTDNNKIPLETKNYDINFYGYYKGQQVIPNVTISGSNTGITTSKTNTYIRFAVTNNVAITNLTNDYTIKFTYEADGASYTINKKVTIVLALKGSDGTSVNILGSYNSLAELKAAHPTGNIGDAYLINGEMYVWNVEINDWDDVGNIQGPAGNDGQEGKSAYQIWLDAGNTGTEEDYIASLKGEKGDTGEKGEQGIQGATGKDGTSYYFYVKYSINSNGNPMTVAPTDASKYMGVASTSSSTAPTSYSAYTWSLIKGSDGQNGSPGQNGADGKSSYLHIKYSDDGTTFTANNGETVGRYRGELVDNIQADSTNFNDYTWYDMALIVDEELNNIREEVQTNLTSIQQSMEEITMTALQDYVAKSEFETYQEQVSTEFTQTAEDFTFNFNNLTSQITTIEGDTQQQFQEINKYIRFVDGTIVLGEAGNELTLVQQNDRISFIQNNNEVAYFSNNELTVTDARFLNSIRIGNFAWKPRDNGNLSLVYVGGES